MTEPYRLAARAIAGHVSNFRQSQRAGELEMIRQAVLALMADNPDVVVLARRLMEAFSAEGLEIYHLSDGDRIDLHLNDCPLIVIQFQLTGDGPGVAIVH